MIDILRINLLCKVVFFFKGLLIAIITPSSELRTVVAGSIDRRFSGNFVVYTWFRGNFIKVGQ